MFIHSTHLHALKHPLLFNFIRNVTHLWSFLPGLAWLLRADWLKSVCQTEANDSKRFWEVFAKNLPPLASVCPSRAATENALCFPYTVQYYCVVSAIVWRISERQHDGLWCCFNRNCNSLLHKTKRDACGWRSGTRKDMSTAMRSCWRR